MISEHQQVAALVCWDIDTWLEQAEKYPETALECFREVKKNKDKAINDPKAREMRYSAACSLFALTHGDS